MLFLWKWWSKPCLWSDVFLHPSLSSSWSPGGTTEYEKILNSHPDFLLGSTEHFDENSSQLLAFVQLFWSEGNEVYTEKRFCSVRLGHLAMHLSCSCSTCVCIKWEGKLCSRSQLTSWSRFLKHFPIAPEHTATYAGPPNLPRKWLLFCTAIQHPRRLNKTSSINLYLFLQFF